MSDEEDEENEKKLKTIKELLGGLTPREAEVLKKRFGVELQTDEDLKEIGDQFDVTRKRIKEIENKALKKLSKSRDEKQKIPRQKIDECSFCGIELSNKVKLSLIHISEPTRQEAISYAVFCLKKKT